MPTFVGILHAKFSFGYAVHELRVQKKIPPEKSEEILYIVARENVMCLSRLTYLSPFGVELAPFVDRRQQGC
jgi:hypothetical protein